MENKRNRKTAQYEELCKTLRDNLYQPLGTLSQKKLAKKLGLPASSISAWANGLRLPSVDQLVVLAEELGVSLDWLMTPHDLNTPSKALTYTDAFLVLQDMISRNLVKRSGVNDYFLAYMLIRTEEIRAKGNIPLEKKEKWYRKFLKDYAIPIQPALTGEEYLQLEKTFGDISPDETNLAILHIIYDVLSGNADEQKKYDFLEALGHNVYSEDFDVEKAIACI